MSNIRVIDKVGAEREGFVAINGVAIDTSCVPQVMNGRTFHQLGTMGSDAGIGHYEAASVPSESLHAAVFRLSALEEGLLKQNKDTQIFRQTRRPADITGSGVWVNKPRYAALRRAAVLEAGLEAEAAIDKMTDYAAVHLNISGTWDPLGTDGWFLYNMLNNAAPYMAASIHRDIDDGYGHLNIWRGFAIPERFPQYEYWFDTTESFKRFFEAVPRMIGEVTHDQWVEHPKHPNGSSIMQEFGDMSDLGVCWHFCRIKRSSTGEWYLELRFFPSMGNVPLLRYGSMVLKAVELLLEWYRANYVDRPVLSLQDATPVFARVAKQVPIFPSAPVDREQWEELLIR